MMISNSQSVRRVAFLLSYLLVGMSVYADVNYSNGGVDYSWGTQGLADATLEVVTFGYGVLGICRALAGIFGLYNAVIIVSKVYLGEGGLTKSVLMFFYSLMFFIYATIFMPRIFISGFGD